MQKEVVDSVPRGTWVWFHLFAFKNEHECSCIWIWVQFYLLHKVLTQCVNHCHKMAKYFPNIAKIYYDLMVCFLLLLSSWKMHRIQNQPCIIAIHEPCLYHFTTEATNIHLTHDMVVSHGHHTMPWLAFRATSNEPKRKRWPKVLTWGPSPMCNSKLTPPSYLFLSIGTLHYALDHETSPLGSHFALNDFQGWM